MSGVILEARMTRRVSSCIAAIALLVAFAPAARAADVPAPLLDAYLKVQTDLAGDDLKAAVADAKVVSAEAAKAGQTAEKIRTSADKLAGAAKIDAAREAFGELSDAFIQFAGGKSPGGDVRMAYCPMVKKSWLQRGEKIQNPYFGKEMIGCGEIKK
jgi:uncharacterized protein DUF3347